MRAYLPLFGLAATLAAWLTVIATGHGPEATLSVAHAEPDGDVELRRDMVELAPTAQTPATPEIRRPVRIVYPALYEAR